jgi:calcium-independent phospholipase A2-gamma
MRGVATLVLLNKLELGTGKRICELFDLIVGVSTGGIIAVCLGLLRLSVAETRQLYLDMGREVFASKGNLLDQGFYYDATVLENFFRSRLGEQSFGDFAPQPGVTPHIALIATSVEFLPPDPVTFRNWGPDTNSAYSSIPVWMALRCSTAAPTFFSAKMWQNRMFTDGGLSSNNPTIPALTICEELWGLLSIGVLISVGTGKSPKRRNNSIPAEHLGRSIADSITGDTWFSSVVKRAVQTAAAVALW